MEKVKVFPVGITGFTPWLDKIMKTTIVAFLGLFLLCGCKSVTTTKSASDVLARLHALDNTKTVQSMPQGLQNVYKQVFGEKEFSKVSLVKETLKNDLYSGDRDPLPEGLKKSSVIRKLTESAAFGVKPTFDTSELKTFATDFYSTMENGPFTLSQQQFLFETSKNKKIAFGNVLSAYFIAYQKGKFVLRDGTTLSKPNVSIKLKSGKLDGGIDNDTITGLLTVFEEAFYDYTLATPLYYSLSTSTNYSEIYIKSGNGDYFEKFYSQEISTNNDYLLEGLIPTAKLFVKATEFVSKDDKTNNPVGISERELKFIRFSAAFADTHSKTLSGLIVRSLGSIDGGPVVVMGSFSIGNNETLAKIIETSISCSSRRLMEYELINAFKTYRNKDDAIEFLLNNYESISKRIDNIGSN